MARTVDELKASRELVRRSGLDLIERVRKFSGADPAYGFIVQRIRSTMQVYLVTHDELIRRAELRAAGADADDDAGDGVDAMDDDLTAQLTELLQDIEKGGVDARGD